MAKTNIEATLKSVDTEEWLDIVFYRPIGYWMAIMAGKLRITPNQITVTSIILGMISGVFFFFSDVYLNVVGMLILMFANMLDSADGQLARMTGQTSVFGRWLDGAAGDLWFISIYFFICLRLTLEGFTLWVWPFAAVSGIVMHTRQASLADYYRTLHLMFIKNKSHDEFQRSEVWRKKYAVKSWKKDFFSKFAMMTYVNYNEKQEAMTPKLQKFYLLMREKMGDDISQQLRDEFRAQSKPLMMYANILTFNTRCIVIFISLFLGKPWIYFVFEFTVLQGLFMYMRYRHEQICKHFYDKLFRNEL